MNHLRKCLWTSATKAKIKKFTEGEATSVQGQILHFAPYRENKLSPVLTKLSDEKHKIGLCISQTFPN